MASSAWTCKSSTCWQGWVSVNKSNRHDNLAKILGVSAPKFGKVNQNFAAEMKRSVGLYVKGLLNMVNSGDASYAGPAAPASSKPHLDFGPGGYPKVSISTKLDTLSKEDLEKLFRDYMSQHYCMCILDMIIGTELRIGGRYHV
jgi:hypothetical protein